MSIVCKQRADDVKLLLLDFGASRLKMFENTPHMIVPTITVSEIEKGRQCILALIHLMEQRLAELDVIDERKRDKELEKWPSIIYVIDEFPTFIRKLTTGKANKMSPDQQIPRLATNQKAGSTTGATSVPAWQK